MRGRRDFNIKSTPLYCPSALIEFIDDRSPCREHNDQRSGLRAAHSARHSGCNAPKRPMRAPLLCVLPPTLRVLGVLSARAAAALPTPRAAALEAEAAHTLAAQPPNHSLSLRGGCCQGRVSRVKWSSTGGMPG